MQGKNEHKNEGKEPSLSLEQKRKVCVNNIQFVLSALLEEYPTQFRKYPSGYYFRVEPFMRLKKDSNLKQTRDEKVGVGFYSFMKSEGEAAKLIDKLVEGFTSVFASSRLGGGFRERGHFCSNTDADLDLLLSKSEQFKKQFGTFDIKLFRSLSSSEPSGAPGGPGFYDRKPKPSALEDQNISELVAKLFTGKPMRSVKIKGDLISFEGKRADVEEVFVKALEALKECGLSADGVMSNLKIKYEPATELTLDIGKVAVELNKHKEEGLGLQ